MRSRASSPGSHPRSAVAPPDVPRVALVAAADASDGLARALHGVARVVARGEAEVVVYDLGSRHETLGLLAAGVDGPAIVVLDRVHADVAPAAIRAGASAVLARPVDPAELAAALDAVRAGLLVLDPALRDGAVARPAAGAAAPPEALTQREREVLAMLLAGLSNRRAADRLGIAENTVKAHVAAILAKLGVTTRTEAVTAALRLGLVLL
ncbi:MAG: response regulator transcription factor [Candidatus Eremiobacteraeota bacterium]|nr:response regulator transcription factor [Candidatus Eremiobacteraeota bacterium]